MTSARSTKKQPAKKPATQPAAAAKKPRRKSVVDSPVKKAIADTTIGRSHPKSRHVVGRTPEQLAASEAVAKRWAAQKSGVPLETLTPKGGGKSINPAGKTPSWAGRVNRLTDEERLELVRKYKVTPLQFLLSVMSDENEPMDERIDAAKAAAPYMHKKMPIGIEVNPAFGAGTLINADALAGMREEDLDALLRLGAQQGIIAPATAVDEVRTVATQKAKVLPHG